MGRETRSAEERKAQKREYYLRNVEAIKAKAAARKEQKAVAMAAWREKNREHVKAYAEQYRAENAKMLNARQRQRARDEHQADPGRVRAEARARYARDPEAIKFHTMAVRAKKLGATLCDLTRAELAEIRIAHNGRCAICDVESALTIDHKIPLSRGGQHTKANIQLLCQPCNSRKGNRLSPSFGDEAAA